MDIKIPDEAVIVEFDGAYWHRGSEPRDARKTKKLEGVGWRVVRVKDHGLQRIGPNDVGVAFRESLNKAMLGF